jgi:hypothetical protein
MSILHVSPCSDDDNKHQLPESHDDSIPEKNESDHDEHYADPFDSDSMSDIERLIVSESDKGRASDVSDDRESVDPCLDDIVSFTPATPNTNGVDMLNGCTARTPLLPTQFTHDEKKQRR